MKLFRQIIILSAIALVSCTDKKNAPEIHTDVDLTDKVITLAIDSHTGEYIEMPELYTHAVRFIPDEKDEQLILSDRLKNRGFTLTASGRRDQQLSGRRMFIATLVKDDCRCEVAKIYYSTSNVSEYFVAERINCRHVQNK